MKECFKCKEQKTPHLTFIIISGEKMAKKFICHSCFQEAKNNPMLALVMGKLPEDVREVLKNG